jgi:hypothetical protein
MPLRVAAIDTGDLTTEETRLSCSTRFAKATDGNRIVAYAYPHGRLVTATV